MSPVAQIESIIQGLSREEQQQLLDYLARVVQRLPQEQTAPGPVPHEIIAGEIPGEHTVIKDSSPTTHSGEAGPYIEWDKHGVLRVVASHVMLDSLIASFRQGNSPETIQEQYPALSLDKIYGAIAYYLSHNDEVNDYLRRQDAVWKHWEGRSRETWSPVVERLLGEQSHDSG